MQNFLASAQSWVHHLNTKFPHQKKNGGTTHLIYFIDVWCIVISEKGLWKLKHHSNLIIYYNYTIFLGHSERTSSWHLPIFQHMHANLDISREHVILTEKCEPIHRLHWSRSPKLCCGNKQPPNLCGLQPQSIISFSYSMSISGWLMLCSTSYQLHESWTNEQLWGHAAGRRKNRNDGQD